MGLSEYQRRDSDYSANELYSGKPMVSRIPVVGREQNGLRGLFIGAYFIGSPLKEHGTEAVWTFAGNTYVATKIRGNTGFGGIIDGGRLPNNLYMEQL